MRVQTTFVQPPLHRLLHRKLFVLAISNAVWRVLYTRSVHKNLKLDYLRRRRVAWKQTGSSVKTNDMFMDAWSYSNSVANDRPATPALW